MLVRIPGAVYLAFALVGLSAAQEPPMDALRPDQVAFRALYKEMVETDTSYPKGSCTLLSERIAAHLREAGFTDRDITLFSVPEHPLEGGIVAVLPGTSKTAKPMLLLGHLDTPDWTANAELAQQLRSVLEPLAAYYFLKARTPKGRLIDSVARFHLGNGARLERIDWLGDLSPKGLRESAGIMVNYLYRLDDIEKNHEAYANRDEIAASSAVKKLLKTEGRRLLDMRLS